MTLPPLKRFFGLDEPADPRDLLGLAPGPLTAESVRAALARRLGDLDDHPAGRSAEAEQVRTLLRDAAAGLTAAAARAAPAQPVKPGTAEATLRPRRPALRDVARPAPTLPPRPRVAPAAPRFRLTPFDQQVLAVLVASRGWNAASRSKLVALASAYGVSVQGLVKVVAGLSEYAKAGGPRLGVSEITAGHARMSSPTGAAATVYRQPSSALLRKIGEQLDAERPGVRLRLAAITALVTILAGVLVTWLVLPAARPVDDEPAPRPVASTSTPSPAARPTPARPQAESPQTDVFAARFDRMPTFLGNALPQAAAQAADASATVVEELDRLARQLNVDPTLSLRDVQGWKGAIGLASSGWALMRRSDRDQIRQLVLDTMYVAADNPAVSDELLAALLPGTPDDDPLDVWRGAWKAGMLGEIAGAGQLPPVVVDRARRLVAATFPEMGPDAPLTFEMTADRWLRDAIASLIAITEFDPHVEDRWELWIAAQRELGTGERRTTALLDVMEAAIAGPADLARPGPTVNLVGRMLQITPLTESAAARRRVLAWFADPRISVGDLWVLTSLMSLHDQTPWFGNDLVLPVDADPAMRRRVADLVARRWEAAYGPVPEPATPEGQGVAVDDLALSTWRAARERLESRLQSRGSGMQELAAAARLNAAAALLASREPADARWSLQEAEALLSGEVSVDPSAIEPGQAMGSDGVWAESYVDAGRNLEERLARLRSLRSSAGTDLGPIDAALVVGEAFRGTPSEVRAVAQSVIIDSFATGPTIAMEMVNQLPDAPPNEWLSELITQVTGRNLPAVRSAAWPLETRRALTEHALALRPTAGPPTDVLASIVAEAHVARLACFGRSLPPLAEGTRSPAQVAEELSLQWQRQASTVMARVEVPAGLPDLQRRHAIRQRLASGPIQAFVASQLSILEMLAYVTVAEQPARGREVAQLLDASQQRRDAMAHVVEQSVEVERALAAVWAIRLVSEQEVRDG